MWRSKLIMSMGVVIALVASAGCSSDEDSASSSLPTTTVGVVTTSTGATAAVSTSSTATTAAVETSSSATTGALGTTAVTEPESATVETTPKTSGSADDGAISGYRTVVETLASDDLAGRNNGTAGSVAAQDFLIAQLSEFAQPLVADATGADAFRQPFDLGTNLLAVIPGSDLADQYVIVGAHYDHLGSRCTGDGTEDVICNGATDNATGVAVALAIGRAIASDGEPPRRSVIIALWDAEEDGLLGSAAYVANPAVPLAQTVAYVNLDIQGTNISPSLSDVTVLVGAETGGPNLVAAALAAAEASTLDTVALSLLFGQGRSDHANFVNAGVPSTFFTDATPPCYHTVGDDASIVDYPKMVQQAAAAETLTRDLMNTDALPAYQPDTPPASYDDAVSVHGLLLQAQPDFTRFPNEDRAVADQFVTDLGAIVDAGRGAFDDAAVGTLLSGAAAIVELWASGACDGFLDPTS